MCEASRKVLQLNIILGRLLITLDMVPVGFTVRHERTRLQVAFVMSVLDAWILLKVHEVDAWVDVVAVLAAYGAVVVL